MSPGNVRQVFVAYSWRLYPGPEFRECFTQAGEKCGFRFVYADTRITNEQILDKIEKMILDSEFAIFDISDWNPNVTLELGLARGSGHPWFISINPQKSGGSLHEAPADLRGIDRIQYESFDQLEAGLIKLLRQQSEVGPSRLRGPPPPASPTVLFDGVIQISGTEKEEVHAHVSKGDILRVLARETTGQKFDLYVMDRRNFVKFWASREGHPIVERTDERIVDLKKKIPRDGEWYVILDTYGKPNDREVALEVTVSRQ